VHGAVRDLGAFTRLAEVLIAAVGKPDVVTPAMVELGAVVISGGISWQRRKPRRHPLPAPAASCQRPTPGRLR